MWVVKYFLSDPRTGEQEEFKIPAIKERGT